MKTNRSVLVDSCVISDLVGEKNRFRLWSEFSLASCLENDFNLFINPVIYGEISFLFNSMSDIDDILNIFNIKTLELNNEIMFNSATIFQKYKKNGGKKETILADFAIGSTAEYYGAYLMTRDKKNFKTYFPTVRRIEP